MLLDDGVVKRSCEVYAADRSDPGAFTRTMTSGFEDARTGIVHVEFSGNLSGNDFMCRRIIVGLRSRGGLNETTRSN
jgi:hypothetical protein